ncbi:MAG: glycerol-3-phosphate dehydrogenase [Deltaproteobacteria bacterium]|nr:glycerol-3-phosphate dehydrogenase [Deltaproteobacteria bacterium]
MTTLDARKRSASLKAVSGGKLDLVIVGGGINGAGIAHDAALRGLKVLVLEQKDLGFGTSSRSSKLIHGGLRYLEHYQFKLVFEGTNERAVLRHMAPHLVSPLLFALPVYEGDRHPLWKIDVGLWMYDGLSLFKTEQRHITFRSPKRMLEREPLLNPEGLTGGIVYYDCITDDARLVLENALAAAQLGATVLTRAKVVGVDAPPQGDVRVSFEDVTTGRRLSVFAKGVVNATGAWTDSVRRLAHVESSVIRATKGVHVVLKKQDLAVRQAVAMMAPQDGRVIFAIPWNERTVLGTTDTDDASDPASPIVTRADVEYLLEAANVRFPSADLSPADVISAWVGLRPLIRPDESLESASDVPREHRIYRDGRVVSVAGGKLTTYRKMAEEVVDVAVETIGARCADPSTKQARLPGAVGLDESPADFASMLATEASLPPDVAARLAHVYGARARGVLSRAVNDRGLLERVTKERDVIWAEVVFAVEEEMAMSVEDVLVRRTSLALTADDCGVSAAERVADLIGDRLGHDARARKQGLDEFEASLALTMGWKRSHPA